MRALLKEFGTTLLFTLVMALLCCLIYPLAVWGAAQAVFPVKANGSLVAKDGSYTTNDQDAVGSSLLGQSFSAPQYFHPRPSAAGSGYDGSNSGGSNLGPLSDKLINGVTATAPAPAPATATAPDTQTAATAVAATATAPDTQTAATAAATASSQAAATTTAPAVVETLSFDGVRLRVLHYARDNNINFNFYAITANKAGDVLKKAPLPAADLSKYQDKDGNLNDTALVDAFPHPAPVTDPDDKTYDYVIAGDFATPIPADAVTASGSGLDPHISPENAKLQAQRIADARKITKDKVLQLIEQYTDQPNLGILGDPGVNVLRLNLALDAQAPMPAAPATAPEAAPAATTAPAAAPATAK